MNGWKLCLALFFSLTLSACTTVNFSSKEAEADAKQFKAPSENKSGIYVYRDGVIGAARARQVWVEEECIGTVSGKTFIYKEIPGGQEYKISTSTAIGKNSITLKVLPGKNYFVRQYLIIAPISGMTYLEEKGEVEAIEAIKELRLRPNQCD
ncbi:DUF2846 domain-containing protein [Acidovorax sp. DW039]|uniref:DUF2846 domain-containing protein n=1 Tax=Acidovorax sp. DW039 TaxID=3095606 RepID=UPI00308A0785|nr:DUF2846 domain-containing protein [Acidovorax sp. DW039]